MAEVLWKPKVINALLIRNGVPCPVAARAAKESLDALKKQWMH